MSDSIPSDCCVKWHSDIVMDSNWVNYIFWTACTILFILLLFYNLTSYRSQDLHVLWQSIFSKWLLGFHKWRVYSDVLVKHWVTRITKNALSIMYTLPFDDVVTDDSHNADEATSFAFIFKSVVTNYQECTFQYVYSSCGWCGDRWLTILMRLQVLVSYSNLLSQ